MGRTLPGVPVVLVDPVQRQPVAAGGEGEICLDLSRRPANLMVEYVDDPERNGEAMAGGYYHTGDVASIDADGYITYVGRTDDIFKASDYKISPFELESALLEDRPRWRRPPSYPRRTPSGWPSPRLTWRWPLATTRPLTRRGTSSSFARGRLAPFQRVRRIEFFELPKTVSGKIRRVELRHREERLASEGIVSGWTDKDFPGLTAGS